MVLLHAVVSVQEMQLKGPRNQEAWKEIEKDKVHIYIEKVVSHKTEGLYAPKP